VLNDDPKSGRTSTQSADHLSAAPYLQSQLGGQIAIGSLAARGLSDTPLQTLQPAVPSGGLGHQFQVLHHRGHGVEGETERPGSDRAMILLP
jgi:hypothetical protein